jgi:hypothetical protein
MKLEAGIFMLQADFVQLKNIYCRVRRIHKCAEKVSQIFRVWFHFAILAKFDWSYQYPWLDI